MINFTSTQQIKISFIQLIHEYRENEMATKYK